MSEDLTFTALTAGIGFNDGANKGFWRIQPRDDEGQWIEMGADVLFRFRTGKGNLVVATERGVYVGPSGRPGFARVMVAKDTESGLKAGVYEVESRNLQQFKALLPSEKGSSKGARTDKFGKPVKTLAESQLPDLQNLLSGSQEITSEDERLARGELTPEEKAAEQDGREKSPIANMPAGFEAENPEEVKKLLRESGVDPDEFDKGPQIQSMAEPDLNSRDNVSEIMAEVAYNGDTEKTLDALIQNAEEQAKVKKVKGFNLDRGNVIRSNDGQDFTIEDIDLEAGWMKILTADGRKVTRDIPDPKNPGQMKKTDLFPIDPKKEYSVVQGKSGLPKPAKPASKATLPTAPEEPATPDVQETPEAPAAPEAAETPAKSAKILAGKRRMDDGKLIKRQQFAEGEQDQLRKTDLDPLIDENGNAVVEVDEKGKLRRPRDPNEMLNFLSKVYKNSKFNEQGHLVLMREQSNENGKNIQWEIRAAVTGDKKVAYIFNFKDLDTGEEQTLLHKDQRDSLQSLLGKTNGPEMLADILTGKEDRIYSKTWNTKDNANDVLERAHYFTLQGRTKSPADSAKYYATGYAQRLNNKDGTVLEKEVPSVFDAWDKGDKDTAAERLRAVFGRIPVDEQSHQEAMTALRELFADKYPDVDKRSFSQAVTMASRFVKQQVIDNPENRSIPWASKDKITRLEIGDVVEYENNIGEKSTVRVISKQKTNSSNPVQSDDIFDYGDYVTIIDANGKRTSIAADSLAILKDQDTPLTEYKGRVSGARMREERGVFYTPGTLRFPNQGNVPDRVMKVEELVPGDNLYGKDGSNLGVVVETVPVIGKSGKNGVGILYINRDGEVKKVAVAKGEERGPKIIQNAKSNEPEAPKKPIIANPEESDPDFDLDAIEFETDPNTIERPKTVGLDFNVPTGARRNAEEQLALNAEIQNEIDAMTAALEGRFPGWTYDKSSINASSYFSAGELSELVAKARKEYPDLTDSEIRALLELKHSKQRGFFGKTKQQIIDQLLKEPARYKKADGAIRSISVDVGLNKDGTLGPVFPDAELSDYFGTIEKINNYMEEQGISDKFGSMDHDIRLVGSVSQFNALYRSAGGNPPPGVLGVNIAQPKLDGSFTTQILVNADALRNSSLEEGDYFGTPFTHVIAHEFGHTIQNFINLFGFKTNPAYAKIAAEKITRYGDSSYGEHFAESFSKFLQTGEATEVFKQFLIDSGILSASNVVEVAKKAKD